MTRIVTLLLLAGSLTTAAAGGDKPADAKRPYKDDPAVAGRLAKLGDNTAAWLEGLKVEGLPKPWSGNGYLSRGPFTRGYGNKMAYAPRRQTAFYCGQDHNLPHFNDAWEYHLGSNAWHCLSPPDGGDQVTWSRIKYPRGWDRAGKEKPGEQAAKARDYVRKWLTTHAAFEGGYLHTKVNGGPIMAWHTWDALSWDPRAGKAGQWFWAVLDDQATQQTYLRRYCRALGKDFDTEKTRLKRGIGLWSFDPTTRKWSRWLGEAPTPRMRGMGGSLTYLPDLKRTIWYCGASNVSGGDHQMWTYDAETRKWTQLNPNGKGIFKLVVQKQAPGSEVQMAYGARHRKIVAVLADRTFVYDVAANTWTAAVQDKRIRAHDNRTVFGYDSVNDVFLLLHPERKTLHAYSIKANEWTKLTPAGAEIPNRRAKGYYDPVHNVFVAIDKGRAWVYRYRRAETDRAK